MSGATIGSDGLVIKPKPASAASSDNKATITNISQLPSDLTQEVKLEPAAKSDANHQLPPELPSQPSSESGSTRPRSRRRAGCQEENENEPDRKILRSSPRKNPGTIAGRRMQAPAMTRTRRSVGLVPQAAVSSSCKALATIMNLRSSKELKKLQVHGAGPKAPGIEISTSTLVPLLSTPAPASASFDRRAFNRNRRLTFSSYSSIAASYSSFLQPSVSSASKKVRLVPSFL